MKSIIELYVDIRYRAERYISKFSFSHDKKNYKYDITFVLLIRDEAEYVKEWIDYHTALFPDKKVHFYIIDNKSADNLKEVISEYIKSKRVTYVYADVENYPQSQLYTHAVLKLASKTEFLLCIDTDEFLVPSDPSLNVYEYIKSKIINDNGGLVVNWLCFGSSNYKTKPEGSVLESYLYRSDFSYEANQHVKTIVNPRKVRIYKDAHNPQFKKGYFAINENDQAVAGHLNDQNTYKFLRLHHYAAKSLEEQERKIARGWGKNALITKQNIKHRTHDINDIYDQTAIDVIKYYKHNTEK